MTEEATEGAPVEGHEELVARDVQAELNAVMTTAYSRAEAIVKEDADSELDTQLGETLAKKVREFGRTKSAARGVALTLVAYKLVEPEQDIRCHKAEHDGGFSARAFDTKVTVPFLMARSLPRNVESHWLSQTFSFAGPFVPGTSLKTQPSKAGPLLIEVVNAAHLGSTDVVEAILVGLFVELIRIRNADKVVLTRPKDLPINVVRQLVERHVRSSYRANAPRLPQLVMYAIYQCIVGQVGRYDGAILEPLERLKSADRKRGTIGDVVVAREGQRIEAVEIKLGQPITFSHVSEAIDKVRAESVTRYYLLSDLGIDKGDAEKILARSADFLKQNGCEIIVNGIFDTLSYYLRLLPNTTAFLFNYAQLLETDPDTSYEHRIRWNECCEQL